jgi:hypothetical protein
MSGSVLEVTITHNLRERAEVEVLLNRRLIALDRDRKGPAPDSYEGGAKTQVKLFHRMKNEGAAVIAAYKKATAHKSQRLVGWVEAGCEFVDINGLLCLPLTKAKLVDASANFLGNLAPRQCTVQPCHDRARGRLAALVNDTELPRSVWSLHHLDVEWLATNFLVSEGMCASIWSGGRAFENVDHIGLSPSRREVLAQTTVSEGFIGKKAKRLLELQLPNRDLVMFGPSASRTKCPAEIRYFGIEAVFAALDAHPPGRWLIDRMLTCGSAVTEPDRET